MYTFTKTTEARSSWAESRRRVAHEGQRASLLALAVVVAFPLAVGLRVASDPDLWWHLATGRYIWTEHSIPAVDIFSFTAAGHRWVTHEWLSDLFLYAGYRVVGHAGLSLFFAALVAASFGLVFLRCRVRGLISALSVVLAALASMMTWSARPQILSLFFASLYLYILEREPIGRCRTIWLLAPLTMLWANLHSGFLSGIALVVAFAAGEELRWLRERRGQGAVIGAEGGRLALLALLCAGCGLVTPNGISGATFAFGTLGNGLIQANVREWFSVDFHQPWAWPLLLYWLVLLAVLALSERRPKGTQLLLLLGAAAASLYSARHVPFLSLVGGPILAEQAEGLRARDGERARPMSWPIAAGVALLVAALAGAAGAEAARLWRGGSALVESEYPVAAVDYIEERGLAGRIYNTYHWGGYLIWRGEQVFIDGRTEVYGDEVFGDYLTTHDLKPGWETPLLTYGVEVVLVQRESRLAAVLRESGRWEVAYEDEIATVFRRPSAGAKGNLAG